jgi:hypothetical protein
MSNKPQRQAPRPEPHRPPLFCAHCGTDAHVFISSITPPSPASGNRVAISYTCTRCDGKYHQLAHTAGIAGALNMNPGSQDVLVFNGQYVHCRQPMQQTASGVIALNGPSENAKPGTPAVYLDVRMLQCPCGFRLVLPDWNPTAGAAPATGPTPK